MFMLSCGYESMNVVSPPIGTHKYSNHIYICNLEYSQLKVTGNNLFFFSVEARCIPLGRQFLHIQSSTGSLPGWGITLSVWDLNRSILAEISRRLWRTWAFLLHGAFYIYLHKNHHLITSQMINIPAPWSIHGANDLQGWHADSAFLQRVIQLWDWTTLKKIEK